MTEIIKNKIEITISFAVDTPFILTENTTTNEAAMRNSLDSVYNQIASACDELADHFRSEVSVHGDL